MISTPHSEVTSSFWVQPTWVRTDTANPLYLPVQHDWYTAHEWTHLRDTLRRAEADTGPLFAAIEANGTAYHRAYGTPQCVREATRHQQPEPQSTWPHSLGICDMVSIALGGPEPRWINGKWRNEQKPCPVAWVNSAADVMTLRVPDWGSMDIVQGMLHSREQWQQEHPDEPLAHLLGLSDLPIPGAAPVPSLGYPSFVDLGAYLMGMTHFLTILGGDRATADAFMDLCFELTTGYMDFLLQQRPEHFDAIGGFGGDGTCMLSPPLYERYGAAWDKRLFEHVRDRYGLADDAPCNLHSCGPSAHLYENWGAHPYNRNIAVMQTRLIPGEVGKLRANLPHTELELTFHPPHFDVVAATGDELRDVLWNSARDAGWRDVYLNMFAVVHSPENLWKAERNLQVCKAVMPEIRQRP